MRRWHAIYYRVGKHGEGMRRWHTIYYRVQKTGLKYEKMAENLLQSPENRAAV
jgi:hypothetical protein